MNQNANVIAIDHLNKLYQQGGFAQSTQVAILKALGRAGGPMAIGVLTAIASGGGLSQEAYNTAVEAIGEAGRIV